MNQRDPRSGKGGDLVGDAEAGFDSAASTQADATSLPVPDDDPFAAALDAALAGVGEAPDAKPTDAPDPRARAATAGGNALLGGLDGALADAMADAMAAVAGPQAKAAQSAPAADSALSALAAQGVVLRRPGATSSPSAAPATHSPTAQRALVEAESDAPSEATPLAGEEDGASVGGGFDSLFEDGVAWSSPSTADSSVSDDEEPQDDSTSHATTSGDAPPASGADEGGATPSADASPSAPDAPDEAEREAAAQAEAEAALAPWPPLLAAVNRLLQTVAAPRADAQVMHGAARGVVACLDTCPPPWELRWQGGAWWLNDDWMPAGAELRAQTHVLTAAMTRTRREGFAATGRATTASLVRAAQALVAAAKGDEAALAGYADPSWQWLTPSARNADVEVWASGVVARCVAVADRCQQSATFPADDLIGALDELEQALRAQPGAVFRALELRTGAWTTPWSCCATVATALTLGHRLALADRSARGIALALFQLTTAAAKSGPTPTGPDAAGLALAKSASPSRAWRPAATFAHGALCQLAANEITPVGTLLVYLFEAHKARLAGAQQWLSALLQAGGPWLAPTLLAVGPLPVGTQVAVGAKHVGVVVDLPGKAPPLRPLVQVGTQVVRPNADVVPLRAT